MRIELVKMTIDNFKCIQHQEVNFDPQRIEIGGRNEAGKTTVADAFFYVMFGKDSNFRTKFDIIPLDGKNNQIHHLETSVELEFKVDGEDHKIKRVLTENWVKKRGVGEEKELTGTSTELFVNDIPVKAGEFKEFVSGIISEDKFMLLTSTTYFNIQMGWQERRTLLTSLISNHSYEEIASKPKYLPIKLDIVKSGVEATEKKYKHQLSQTKKEVAELPARIDEASKNINRDAPAGIEELKRTRNDLNDRIDKLKKSDNENYVSQGNSLRNEISRLGAEISAIETAMKSDVSQGKEKANLTTQQQTLTSEITTLNQEISTLNNRIDTCGAGRVNLKELYIALLDKEYSPESTTCPTCNQELPESMKAEAENKFITNKRKKLDAYKTQAGELKESAANLKAELENKSSLLKTKQAELSGVKESLKALSLNDSPAEVKITESPALITKKDQKHELEQKLMNLTPNPSKEEISGLVIEIDQINSQLSGYEASEKAKTRVAELEADLKKSNEVMLEIERHISLLSDLKMEYVETIEGDLNKLFDRKIKVRLFEQQVNGGFRETCDILVQNRQGALVPWQFVNTAGQINSSLQIINLLSKHLDIYCPVFIDHTESVEELFKIDSQVIELKFLASFPKLTIR